MKYVLPRYVYVSQFDAFWKLTGKEWVAICQYMLSEEGRVKGYLLPDNCRLSRKPPGFERNRERFSPEHASFSPPHGVVYVEPLDWEPEYFGEWLQDHGLTP